MPLYIALWIDPLLFFPGILKDWWSWFPKVRHWWRVCIYTMWAGDPWSYTTNGDRSYTKWV